MELGLPDRVISTEEFKDYAVSEKKQLEEDGKPKKEIEEIKKPKNENQLTKSPQKNDLTKAQG